MTGVRMTTDLERHERAVALAEKRWPTRYVGDLTVAEWQQIYREIDADAHPRKELD